MAHLEHTRLEYIEFVYLVVGHTHDLVDALFAYITRALRGCDVLSLPEMFTILNKNMKAPPLWTHLRDIYAFKNEQPAFLASQTVKGVSAPNHVRLLWNRAGLLCLQCKPWVTSGAWHDPIELCTRDQITELRRIWPAAVPPQWPDGFENGATN